MSEVVPAFKKARLLQTNDYDKAIEWYTKTWGMKCNPFWYNAFCDCDGSVEWSSEYQKALRITKVFITMAANEGHLTGVVLDDFVAMAVEHGKDVDCTKDEKVIREWVQVALRLDMLREVEYNGQKYVTLSEKVAGLCWRKKNV
jgi:hypothetical protein